MDNETLVNAVLKIGNHEEVKRVCESNIFYHQELQPWMVKRTLMALGLFKREYKNAIRRRKQSNNQHNGQSGSEGVCQVPPERNPAASGRYTANAGTNDTGDKGEIG